MDERCLTVNVSRSLSDFTGNNNNQTIGQPTAKKKIQSFGSLSLKSAIRLLCALWSPFVLFLTLWTLAHTHTHTGFLPESDPAPVVEFFTRTSVVAAGGQFDFERCVGFIQTGVFKTVVRHRQVQIRV